MNKITILGSGSSGNGYVLECGNEIIVIELGVQLNTLLKCLNYDLTKVRGCLVSHQHLDHSRFIPNALEYALPVFSCQEVTDKHKGVNLLKLGEKTQIGGFKVQPIRVPHSCECYAFLIEHSDMGRMLFCTDCKKFLYKIKNLNHIFIEANYDEELVIDNLCEDMEIRSLYGNHMEIKNTIDALKNNYSASLQTVCLVHLSTANADQNIFNERVKKEIGFYNTYIATKGLEINLELNDF